MGGGRRSRRAGISTLVPVAIAVVVIVLAIAATANFFLLSRDHGGATTSQVSGSSSTATSTFVSPSYSSSVTTSQSPAATAATASATGSSSSQQVVESSAPSNLGMVAYAPSCIVLYSGAVSVFGTISPSSVSGNVVESVKLYWSYHGQNSWSWLNDLTYGPSFSSDGNFTHVWNPPEAAYYDFQANWTLSGGGAVTAITSQPFWVVAQGSSCP